MTGTDKLTCESIEVKPSSKILTPRTWIEEYESLCESIARTARKSWKRQGTNPDFLLKRIVDGEENVVEHAVITVRWVVSRSIAQQLTRHRIASYCGSSLRILEHSLEWVMPAFQSEEAKVIFAKHAQACADCYAALLALGEKPEEARDAFPLATAQTLDSTLNLSSWRNVFRKRCSPKAQKPHREMMGRLRDEFKALMPKVFGDL